MKYPIYLALIILFGCKASSDSASISKGASELFRVNGKSIFTDEFIYVYKKNNINNDSAFTTKDIQDYLDLYVNFKLKVAEAESRGMDTTRSFEREFNTYREQLKKPYLTDNKVTEQLLTEAYNRYKEEVNASHILITVAPDAPPKDTLEVYNKLCSIRKEALKGTDFSLLAKKHSDDPSARQNGGNLGYFTSFQMVYPFESAAYKTKEGEISLPVRTKYGYHIIKVLDKRPSQGRVEVSHIMIKSKPNSPDSIAMRNKAFEIYDQVVGGVNWGDLTRQFSDDFNTKSQGGKLKPFTVGQMPYAFQEAAFNLQEPGAISDPVKTPYGWHIIKLEQKLPLESFEEKKSSIKSKIGRDSRAELNKKAVIDRLKKENGFEETMTKAQIISAADAILSNDSAMMHELASKVLFRVANRSYSGKDFFRYLKENQQRTDRAPKDYLNAKYNNFVEDRITAYEESHLKNKYLDYRMLVNEYREGILLFELMQDEIWEKAVKDTTGLKAFFHNNRGQYQWEKRVDALICNADQQKIIDDIAKHIASDSARLSKKELEKQFNNKTALTLQVDEGIFQRGENNIVDKVEWQKGIHQIRANNRYYLIWIRSILAPGPKALKDIRGSVISDYQNRLESIWVKELRDKYPVKFNKGGLKYIYEVLEK